MDGLKIIWMDGLTDRWKNNKDYIHMYVCMDGWMENQRIHKLVAGKMHRWVIIQKDDFFFFFKVQQFSPCRWLDGKMDGCMDGRLYG